MRHSRSQRLGFIPGPIERPGLMGAEPQEPDPQGAAAGEGCNNSDVDLIEIDGKTHVYYSTGDQATWGELRQAIYPGTMAEFFESYFPEGSQPIRVDAR